MFISLLTFCRSPWLSKLTGSHPTISLGPLKSYSRNKPTLPPGWSILTNRWGFRLWSQVLNNFVAGEFPKVPIKDHKVAVVGLTRILTQSDIMMQEPSIHTLYIFLS